jgi:arylsulfatase A-like enzyme
MKRIIAVRWFVLILVSSYFNLIGSTQETALKKPNIVILLADDMGWAFPGFNGGLAKMPNVEALEKKSLNLTQFYAQPVCTPSRACILTGRFPFQTGTEQRFNGNDSGGMLKDERTLAQALKDVGYFTAIFGKWHLGEWQSESLPRSRGFDYQYGMYGAMVDYFRKVRIVSKKDSGYGEEAVPGSYVYDWHRNGQPLIQDGYTTYLIADEVESVLNTRDSSKPFFFYVAFNAVHSPSDSSQLPPELREKGTKPKYTQAYCLDQAVGRIFDSLKKRNLIDNTILVFTNDNGGVVKAGDKNDKDNGSWRGGKGDFYEGGIRMPCLLSWPAQIHEAKKIDAMLHMVDFYPTLVNLAGGSIQQPLPLSGKDMWPILSGKETSIRDEIPFSMHVIRKGDWKLIEKEEEFYGEVKRGAEKRGDELYNLKEDITEQHNVAKDHPEIMSELKALLKKYAEQARPPDAHEKISGGLPKIYGEEEAKTFPGVVFEKKDVIYSIKPVSK